MHHLLCLTQNNFPLFKYSCVRLYFFIVNLAVALKLLYPAKEIGLLDADVFGPSIPLMMNLHETPLLTNGNTYHIHSVSEFLRYLNI